MIESAWPELRATVLKMRPDWPERDLDGARIAALNTEWTWPKFALEIMRLATDSEARPHDFVVKATGPRRRGPAPPGDWKAGADRARDLLEHRATPSEAAS